MRGAARRGDYSYTRWPWRTPRRRSSAFISSSDLMSTSHRTAASGRRWPLRVHENRAPVAGARLADARPPPRGRKRAADALPREVPPRPSPPSSDAPRGTPVRPRGGVGRGASAPAPSPRAPRPAAIAPPPARRALGRRADVRRRRSSAREAHAALAARGAPRWSASGRHQARRPTQAPSSARSESASARDRRRRPPGEPTRDFRPARLWRRRPPPPPPRANEPPPPPRGRPDRLLPADWTLKTRLKFTSDRSLAWVARRADPRPSDAGVRAFCAGVATTRRRSRHLSDDALGADEGVGVSSRKTDRSSLGAPASALCVYVRVPRGPARSMNSWCALIAGRRRGRGVAELRWDGAPTVMSSSPRTRR